MKKINIITGAPLTGKSEFIKSEFSNNAKFYHIDIPSTFVTLFDEVDTQNTENLTAVYNKINDNLIDLFFLGDHELVFEFSSGFENTDKLLIKLIEQMKELNIEVRLKHLDCSEEEAIERKKEVKTNPNYFSSYFFNEDLYNIMSNFLADYKVNSQLA